MNEENIPAITDKEELYDKCENMEQLFDKYYLPLLDKHYSKVYELQQQNQKYKEVIFKIKMRISARIKQYQQKIDNEIDMGSQGDHFKICKYEENIKFLKDILKEVE